MLLSPSLTFARLDNAKPLQFYDDRQTMALDAHLA